MISGLAAFFTVTTIVVVLYPIIRLTPSWLERSLYRKIAFHRDAQAALETALSLAHNDPAQVARLKAQRDYHLAALSTLAPDENSPTIDRVVDAA